MHRRLFRINLKLHIGEIPAQQQPTLCFSGWPSAITRMCNYNFAQVKFNQSPEHKELAVSQENEEEGTERERKKGEERGKGEREGGCRGRSAQGAGSCRSLWSKRPEYAVGCGGEAGAEGRAERGRRQQTLCSLLGAQNHALCFVLK